MHRITAVGAPSCDMGTNMAENAPQMSAKHSIL